MDFGDQNKQNNANWAEHKGGQLTRNEPQALDAKAQSLVCNQRPGKKVKGQVVNPSCSHGPWVLKQRGYARQRHKVGPLEIEMGEHNQHVSGREERDRSSTQDVAPHPF